MARLLAGFGTFPPYFLELRELNRRGPRVYGEALLLSPLDAGATKKLVDDGAAVVDVRPVEAFAAGHVAGSLSIPLRPQFASWLGWLVGRDRSLVFVLDEGQDRAELVRQCLSIGYERLAGELIGGVQAWRDHGQARGTLVDVRQRSEFAVGHVQGAINVELGETAEQASQAPAGPTTVMCGHGERAMSAASILAAQGRTDVFVLAGGPDDVAAARRQRLAV